MAENNHVLEKTINTLFQGMEEFITSKTVVGEAVYVGDTVLLPLMDVSFGVAATSKAETSKRGGGGGMGGKMSPTAVLVIRGGSTKLVNIKNPDGISKRVDMVPDLVNRFMPGSRKEDPEVKKAVDDIAGQEEKF